MRIHLESERKKNNCEIEKKILEHINYISLEGILSEAWSSIKNGGRTAFVEWAFFRFGSQKTNVKADIL